MSFPLWSFLTSFLPVSILGDPEWHQTHIRLFDNTYQHHYSSQQPKETSGSTLKMSSLWQATCLQTWVGTLTLSTRLHPQCWNQDPHWSIVNPLARVALTIPDKFESQLINLPFPCGTHSLPLWLMWSSRSTWQVCLDTVTTEPSPELCHCNAGRVK